MIGDAAHSMPPTRAQGANQALEDAWAMAAALRAARDRVGGDATGGDGTGGDRVGGDVAGALRSFERARSRKASVVARHSGSEDYNRYGRLLARLVPSSLASRYYTRWLAQISTFLPA